MKIVGVNLQRDILLIHYVDEEDKVVDERIVAVKWKSCPPLCRLIKSFSEVAAHYILTDNKNLEKIKSEDIDRILNNIIKEEESR